jgi:mannose-6-phosphate isomerase-like protein (cupin superfamily)
MNSSGPPLLVYPFSAFRLSAPTFTGISMTIGIAKAAMVSALLAACQSGAREETAGRPNYGRPTVFAPGKGEHRLMRGTRPLFIVADSTTVGSRTLTAGYEEVPPGDSGRAHMHLEQDEMLFVHRGTLDVFLDSTTYRAVAGTTVFIPRHTWIGFRPVGPDTAGFFFVFNAPGFEKCLRALSVRPGEQYVALEKAAFEKVRQECHYQPKGG